MKMINTIEQIKIYDGSVDTNFQSKKMREEEVPCQNIPIILLDYTIKAKNKKYYPIAPLEECKY